MMIDRLADDLDAVLNYRVRVEHITATVDHVMYHFDGDLNRGEMTALMMYFRDRWIGIGDRRVLVLSNVEVMGYATNI